MGNFFGLIFVSAFLSLIVGAIILAIFNTVMEKFYKSKGLDVTSHQEWLTRREFKGKDQEEYEKYTNKVYIVLIVIFTICFYFLLPIIDKGVH